MTIRRYRQAGKCGSLISNNESGEWAVWSDVREELATLRARVATLEKERDNARAENERLREVLLKEEKQHTDQIFRAADSAVDALDVIARVNKLERINTKKQDSIDSYYRALSSEQAETKQLSNEVSKMRDIINQLDHGGEAEIPCPICRHVFDYHEKDCPVLPYTIDGEKGGG